MGWIIMIALAGTVMLALWRIARLAPAALQMIGAVFLLGMAGYAWQGRPGLAGQPHAPIATAIGEDSVFALLRGDMMGRFGGDAQWLDFADTMHRYGDDPLAVKAVLAGLQRYPRSAYLWTGLGNALTLANEGSVTPPARFAYDRAIALGPRMTGPSFFLGMSLIEAGQLDEGADVWRALLRRLPANAQWRGAIAERLALVDRLRASR